MAQRVDRQVPGSIPDQSTSVLEQDTEPQVALDAAPACEWVNVKSVVKSTLSGQQ